jgi:hypothetical protein
MPPQINLNELYSIQKKKKQKRTVCFDKILELCHNRIKTIAESNGQNTFYEIPGILAGYPLYDLYECLEYIVDALRKNGFLVQILPPPHVAVIYISWDPDELKPPKPVKQIKPRYEIANQQHEYTNNLLPSTMLPIKNNLNNRICMNNDTMGGGSCGIDNGIMRYDNKPIKVNKNEAKKMLKGQETRSINHEPFYLASLRLF